MVSVLSHARGLPSGVDPSRCTRLLLSLHCKRAKAMPELPPRTRLAYPLQCPRTAHRGGILMPWVTLERRSQTECISLIMRGLLSLFSTTPGPGPGCKLEWRGDGKLLCPVLEQR